MILCDNMTVQSMHENVKHKAPRHNVSLIFSNMYVSFSVTKLVEIIRYLKHVIILQGAPIIPFAIVEGNRHDFLEWVLL